MYDVRRHRHAGSPHLALLRAGQGHSVREKAAKQNEDGRASSSCFTSRVALVLAPAASTSGPAAGLRFAVTTPTRDLVQSTPPSVHPARGACGSFLSHAAQRRSHVSAPLLVLWSCNAFTSFAAAPHPPSSLLRPCLTPSVSLRIHPLFHPSYLVSPPSSPPLCRAVLVRGCGCTPHSVRHRSSLHCTAPPLTSPHRVAPLRTAPIHPFGRTTPQPLFASLRFTSRRVAGPPGAAATGRRAATS